MKAVAYDVKTNFLIWRVCVWGGPIFLVAMLGCWAGLGKFFPPPPSYWSADDLVAFYSGNNLQIRAGMVGVMFFGAFYLLWSSVLSRIIQRIEGPEGVLANIELMGGVTTTMVVELFGALWLVASFRTGLRSPEVIQAAHDLGWFIFDMTFMVTFFQMVSFGTAVLIDKRNSPLFPRWLGWLSYLAAFVFLPVVLIAFFTDGPFAWHGFINYYVALGPFFIWMIATTIIMFNAINRIEVESMES